MGGPAREAPSHPVTLRLDDDGRRSRVTVLFRPLLAFPHLAWLGLWSIPAAVAALANLVVTLARERPPAGLHRFLSAYVRCSAQLLAFVALVANPFPGFVGAPGYPADVEIQGPERQRRLVTLFRPLLALPALLVASALVVALAAVALLGWLSALATGRMPAGLRNAGAFCVRYVVQALAYLLVLTDVYPGAKRR